MTAHQRDSQTVCREHWAPSYMGRRLRIHQSRPQEVEDRLTEVEDVDGAWRHNRALIDLDDPAHGGRPSASRIRSGLGACENFQIEIDSHRVLMVLNAFQY
jgi:hypothetical protein